MAENDFDISGGPWVPDGWESIGAISGSQRFLEVAEGPWPRVRLLSRRGQVASVQEIESGAIRTVEVTRLHFARPIQGGGPGDR